MQISLLSLNIFSLTLSFANLYANSFSRTFNPPPSQIPTAALLSLQSGSQRDPKALGTCLAQARWHSVTFEQMLTCSARQGEKGDGSGNFNSFPPFLPGKPNPLKSTVSYLCLSNLAWPGSTGVSSASLPPFCFCTSVIKEERMPTAPLCSRITLYNCAGCSREP